MSDRQRWTVHDVIAVLLIGLGCWGIAVSLALIAARAYGIEVPL